MSNTSRRDRVMAATQCMRADRVPVSFWYHFPLEFPSGKPLAEAEIEFFRKYDVDFLKVMHDLPLDLPEDMAEIGDPADWAKIRPLDPRKGNFAHQLEALKIMRRELGDDVIIIDTVFNPHHAAGKMCGKRFMEHYRKQPEAVIRALRTITVSLIDYAQAWVEEGGDGIYYALDGAQTTCMSEEEYGNIFKPLDYMILEAAMGVGAFNFLHIHGTDIMFDLLHDLPNNVLGWSNRLTAPTLGEARRIHQGCIAGGIDEENIKDMTPADVLRQGRSSIEDAGADGFILTSGCAVPTDTPEEILMAIRQSVNA
ncbi:MAG: hypothetical protein KBC96_03140 [Armatimonadetes bacterium]|nr:hypothetical protein [Armatimonadota bacterium]